ncbi:hypothetical protein AWB67_06822 [Caballeronia terrestris]|uniref:Uncharacterized protein n=1 Tax=Caballeronia terrestris TaxID=1226301 RepID=A0A158KV05_9BURK|nr:MULTISPECIES: hypothetical protein [Caballeronia]SAL06091.1 hypothetical protein AWB81_07440 [Caballeronia arationis]SAL84996.1 hypothetical protein AWB67_06822 [Caballeronia terrestris]
MDAYTLTRARQSEQVAREWKEYAHSLERKLAIYAANYAGMEAVKDIALQELLRMEPNHRLAVQQNRQSIFDEARSASLRKERT